MWYNYINKRKKGPAEPVNGENYDGIKQQAKGMDD